MIVRKLGSTIALRFDEKVKPFAVCEPVGLFLRFGLADFEV